MQSSQLPDALGHGVADKRIDILRAIARTGSISQAARDAAVSYKAAWQAVDTLTNLAGVPLVNRAVGGAGGGGASLTTQGQQLLDLADMLSEARQRVYDRWTTAAVAAGRATQPDGSLQAAQSVYARLSLRTSMRNQLPCTIAAMEHTGRIVRVVMHLAGSGNMTARITSESAELLGLEVGMTVIALCKATAVVVAREGEPDRSADPHGNHLVGRIEEVAAGESGDEVTVELAGSGLQLVGFAPAGSGMVLQQPVVVSVDESAVVVALPG